VPYWQHYCHLVWGTKNREPVIDDASADVIRQAFREICGQERAKLLALGIMPEHVHVAVSIPPRIAISDFVKLMKGRSSFRLNESNRIDQLARLVGKANMVSFPSGGVRFLPLLRT